MERGQQTRRGCWDSAEHGFVLRWGRRKRLRCVKIQVSAGDAPVGKAAAVRSVGRRVVRSCDRELSAAALRRASHSHRVLRQNCLPDLKDSGQATVIRSLQRQQVNGMASGRVTLREMVGGEEEGAGSDSILALPRFEIALSNKEKEEDFMIFKGCNKLPLRPKKRAKCIQRTVNLVCPGTWLCDLTQERYEVREKKISKKRPRGLKAMGSADSNSD